MLQDIASSLTTTLVVARLLARNSEI
jgi:hypothetical protein